MNKLIFFLPILKRRYIIPLTSMETELGELSEFEVRSALSTKFMPFLKQVK